MATKTWVGAGAKKWGTAANWSPSGVPVDGDDVILDSTDTDDCNLDENTANLNSFTMDTGYTGEFDMAAGYILRIEYTADGSHFTGTQGTFLGASGTIKVSGNWTLASGFVFTNETCSVEHTGSGTITIADIANAFYDCDVGAAGKTTSTASSFRVANQFTLGTGTLIQLAGTKAITIGINSTTQSDPFVNGGGSMTVSLVFSPATSFNVPAGTNYYRLSVEGSNLNSPPHQATLQGAITVANNLVTNGRYAHLDTAGYNITHNAGSFAVGISVYATKLKCNGSTITLNGALGLSSVTANAWIEFDTSTWDIAGAVVCASVSANWDEGTGIVKLTGDSAQNIDWNGQDIYDIEVSGTGQKNLTGSFKCRHFTAKNNVTVKITDVGVTWTTFASAVISADATYLLTLRSSIDNNQWDMVAGTGVTALRVDVKDSNNTGTSIDATDASNTDSGNNNGWNFGGGIVPLAGSLAGQSALSAQYLELLMEILGTTAGQSNLPATPLKKAFDIVGSLAGQSGVDGAIGLFKLLAGEISGLSNLPDADMKLLMELLGTCNGQAGTLVNLGVAYSVLGSISGQSGETAVLKAIKKIIGSLDAQSGLTGDLSVEAVILLEGNIGGYSGVLATPLEVLMKITGTVDAQSGVDGEIKLTMELIGDIGGLSTADATLKAIRGLAGDVDAISSLSGTLQSIAYLLGTVTGTSDVDGALKVTLQLVGVIDGQSVVLGELTQIVSTLIGLTKISSMMSDMLTKITTEDDDLITEIWTVM